MKDNSLNVLTVTSESWLTVGEIMSENVATIDRRSDVVLAAQAMSGRNISCIVVLDDGAVAGIITETDMLRKSVVCGDDLCRMKVDEMMSYPVRSVSADLSVRQASEIMETEKIRRLVITDRERPVGIVTQTDIVQVLASHTLSQKVSDAMMTDVVVVGSSTCVKEAAELMASRDISCLVIVDGATVAGIFTERDFLRRVVAEQRDSSRTSLEQVMSSPVVIVEADHSILGARRLLEQTGIRRLVVTENETICGIITQTDIHRAIRRRLQDEEGNYLKLLDGSSNCIYAIDLNLVTTYVNPAFMKLLDVTEPGKLLDRPFLPEMFWDDPQQRDRTLNLLKRATAEVAEVTLRSAGGRRVFATLFSARTRDAKGQINGSQGVLHDITTKKELADLREMQQRLRDSEELLRAILESTADGILAIDENGRTSHVNARFLKIWGIPEELMLRHDNRKLFEYIGSRLENKSEFLSTLKAPQLSCEESFDILQLTEGKILDVHSLPLIRDASVIGRVWNFRDVTERKRAEDDLRISEGKLNAMLSSIADHVSLIDKNATIVWANEMAKKAFGSDIVGKKCYKAYRGSNRLCEPYPCPTLRAFHDGGVHQHETQITDKEGKTGYFQCTANIATRDETGRPTAVIEVARDITDHRQAEQALRATHDELEERVRRRTAELSQAKEVLEAEIVERERVERELEELNTQLEASVQDLSRSNRELQEFAYIAAHDLKTPLRGIGTLADWLASDYADRFDERGKRHIGLLAARAGRMSTMIDSILQYSALARRCPKKRQVDLNSVLADVIAGIERPETIEITAENSLPVLTCNEEQIAQVFQNLLGNAVMHMGKPNGQIKVRCIGRDGFWQMSVADNGPGIDRRYFKKIFKMFRTLSPCEESESTGVGLAVVKKIVELNGGRVWVESHIGGGSTFFFVLPKQGTDVLCKGGANETL
jgi:PAS domain S-box-containing protein